MTAAIERSALVFCVKGFMENLGHPANRQEERRHVSFSHFASLFIIGLLSFSCVAQDIPAHPKWPGPGQLFVGTCYQPIDRTPEEIDGDIAIMKQTGFNVARIGDLS